MASLFYATVTQISPRLLIATDSDPAHPVPATRISTYTPVVGHRVRVEDRVSGGPIVQGRV